MEVSRGRINTAATAAFRRTADELGANRSGAACAALCRRSNAVLDAEFARVRSAGAAVACAAGCAFCCHQRVGVLPHEALALAEHLENNVPVAEKAAIRTRIRANAARIDGLTLEQHLAANLACAFLSDGRCAVYAVRPSVCASFHSMSKARCEASFNDPQGIGTPRNSRPVLVELAAMSDALIAATSGGLAAAGLANNKGELHQTLRALLDDAGAAERWRAGGVLAPTGTAA